MTLLQGNIQGCEAVLRGKGLAGSRGEQEPNHLVMVLLQTPTLLYWDTADGSGSGLIWREKTLTCFVVLCTSKNVQLSYLYLSRHVEWSESILRLHIDAGGVSHKDLHDLVLPGEAGNVQGGVALLGGRVDLGAPGQQLRHDALVTLLAGQVQRIESVLAKKKQIKLMGPEEIYVLNLATVLI